VVLVETAAGGVPVVAAIVDWIALRAGGAVIAGAGSIRAVDCVAIDVRRVVFGGFRSIVFVLVGICSATAGDAGLVVADGGRTGFGLSAGARVDLITSLVG